MRKLKLKPMQRAFERAQIKIDEETRTIEFPFSSEEPVSRWFGKEILSHDKSAIDLARFNDGANVLFNHDWDSPIGVIEKAWIGTDKRGYLKMRFSKNAKAQEVYEDVKDGVLRNVSFGYEILDIVRQRTSEEGDEYLATKWMPFEASIVTVPADQTVGIGRDRQMIEREFDVEDEEEKSAPKEEEKSAEEIKKEDEIIEIKTIETPVSKGTNMTEQELKALREKAQSEERERAAAITALGEKFNQREFATDLIKEGASLEVARERFLEKISVRQEAVNGANADIGLSEKEVRTFSFIRAINAMANPADRRAQEAAKFEREVSDAAAKAAGKTARGFFVPFEILRSKRDLNVGTPTAGGNLVATDLLSGSFIELLRKKSVLDRAGARTLNGLVGDIAIPKQTGGATAYWVGEGGAPTESQAAFGQVGMTPKAVAAYTELTRKLLLQSSIDVEALVRADLATVLALEVDRAGIYGIGSANQPLGLTGAAGLNTKDFAAANPTYAEIVDMESRVAADDADSGTMSYILNALMRGHLKSTEKFSSTGMTIWEPGNTVNGYQAFVSNQLVDGDVIFGNFADLMIGYWSGLDILVNPYALDTTGGVRVTIFQDVDVATRHGQSFCLGNDDQ